MLTKCMHLCHALAIILNSLAYGTGKDETYCLSWFKLQQLVLDAMQFLRLQCRRLYLYQYFPFLSEETDDSVDCL